MSDPAAAPDRRKRWMRAVFEVLLVGAAFVGIRAWQRKDVIDGPAPALHARTIDGRDIALAGHGPTLVHFWANWCGACDAMDGQVASVAEHARVITVATRSGDENAIRASLQEEGLMRNGQPIFDVIADPRGVIARQWGVTTLPTSFVIDENGHIFATEVGVSSAWGLRARMFLAR